MSEPPQKTVMDTAVHVSYPMSERKELNCKANLGYKENLLPKRQRQAERLKPTAATDKIYRSVKIDNCGKTWQSLQRKGKIIIYIITT